MFLSKSKVSIDKNAKSIQAEPMPQIEINSLFEKAFNLMENSRESCFITGKAGTGKSTLLDYFRNKTKKRIAVLAPTGVAAINVKGQTIHSFFKFKPNITLLQAEKIAHKIRSQNDTPVYAHLDCIVIDEISMVRADLLDCIDIFLKTYLKKRTPFGGLQMIFIGDLYQLPPVVQSQEKEIFTDFYKGAYFFHAHIMEETEFKMIELEKVYRQKDPEFVRLLNTVRNNSITEADIEKFNVRFDTNFNKDKGYVTLTSTNDQASLINIKKLDEIKEKSKTYTAIVQGNFGKEAFPTETDLVLKKGAQVMLLNNDSLGRWVNGTMGEILALNNDSIRVKLENGETEEIQFNKWDIFQYGYHSQSKTIVTSTVGSFSQLPVKLAWAVTIHKSQGKTFDRVIIDVGRGTFANGQMYVALSRCRSLSGIVLRQQLLKRHVRVDYKIMKFLTQHQYSLSEKENPLENKVALIKKAIDENKKITLTYLKAQDEKTRRILKPLSIGDMEYNGKNFLGLRAFCEQRQDERTFRVDRILEIRVEC